MTKNFLVLTHVSHHNHNGKLKAYAPYVREMNLWFKNVDRSTVIAPISNNGSFAKEETYHAGSLNFRSIPSFDLLSSVNMVKAILKVPVIGFQVIREMKRADHLHLRCPGNIGLIASFCQLIFPKKPKTAKYAGNWDPKAKQPWSYRLQKWILKNPILTRNMQVLVYGDWPDQTKNIKPFFTASFSEAVIREVREKTFQAPFTFLFVGNLVEGKQPVEAIRLVQGLKDSGAEVSLEIYGSGPEREKLENYCLENDLQEDVQFFGKRSLEELKAAYQKAHFVVLPSRSEGWPKALAEGMFFGCIPIATPVSCVRWMLGNGSRGVLLSDSLLDTPQKSRQFECSSDPAEAGMKNVSRTGFSETNEVTGEEKKVSRSQRTEGSEQWTVDLENILCLMRKPEEMERMSLEAKRWSQQYTLERFEKAIKEVLNKSNEKSSFSKVQVGDQNTFPGSL